MHLAHTQPDRHSLCCAASLCHSLFLSLSRSLFRSGCVWERSIGMIISGLARSVSVSDSSFVGQIVAMCEPATTLYPPPLYPSSTPPLLLLYLLSYCLSLLALPTFRQNYKVSTCNIASTQLNPTQPNSTQLDLPRLVLTRLDSM